jgi:outer membrane protein assembly factor BamB
MNPVWGPNSSVLFNDQEGRLYSLDLATGTQNWEPAGGVVGTYTEAAAVYDPGHNVVVVLGMKGYSGVGCNPYVAPGILPICGNAAFKKGIISGYSASTGHPRWTRETPHPPASAGIGMLSSAFPYPQPPTPAPPTSTRPTILHTRVVVTMGFNCFRNSPSVLWILDPDTGNTRSEHEGPTLWSSMCAGDKEGGDIRRAMGGRATCSPGSWSAPVVDADGDVYVGNQVGVFWRVGSETRSWRDVDVLSTLTTGVAFQDASTALAAGLMAVATCTSLIVFQAENFAEDFQTGLNWTAAPHGYSGSFDASSADYTR